MENEKFVQKKGMFSEICSNCHGTGIIHIHEKTSSFSRGNLGDRDTVRACGWCKGTGCVIGRESSIKEMDGYSDEPCDIQDAIFDLIDKIKQKYSSITNPNAFWILLEKKTYCENKESGDEETTVISFVLDIAGNLKATTRVECIKIGFKRPQFFYKYTTGFENFDEYMKEFDFNTYNSYYNQDFHEYTYLTCDYKSYIGYPNPISHIRRNYEKGYGLYYALKCILDEDRQPQIPKDDAPSPPQPSKTETRDSIKKGAYSKKDIIWTWVFVLYPMLMAKATMYLCSCSEFFYTFAIILIPIALIILINLIFAKLFDKPIKITLGITGFLACLWGWLIFSEGNSMPFLIALRRFSMGSADMGVIGWMLILALSVWHLIIALYRNIRFLSER